MLTIAFIDHAHPSDSRVLQIDDPIEAAAASAEFLERLMEITGPKRKRVIVTQVSPEYQQRYLKPGQVPVHKYEVFPSGAALAHRLGRKSYNLVAMAISKAKTERRLLDPADDSFVGALVGGLQVAYVEDYDTWFGAGTSDSAFADAKERRIREPDWGIGLVDNRGVSV